MAVPTWATNQVLLASDVNNWFVPIPAYKTSSLARTSSTRSLDPDLQITLAASAVYEIRAGFNWLATAGVGFSWGFTTPTSASGGYQVAYSNSPALGLAWTATETPGSNGAPNYGAVLVGVLVTSTSGGTFGLQWASGTNSSSCTIGVGSYILAQRIG